MALSDFQYAGEQKDGEARLINLRARYYDPALGRFLSRDRLSGRAGFPQSFNRYAYALNNPLRDVDPSGYCSQGSSTGSDSACSRDAEDPYWDDGGSPGKVARYVSMEVSVLGPGCVSRLPALRLEEARVKEERVLVHASVAGARAPCPRGRQAASLRPQALFHPSRLPGNDHATNR